MYISYVVPRKENVVCVKRNKRNNLRNVLITQAPNKTLIVTAQYQLC